MALLAVVAIHLAPATAEAGACDDRFADGTVRFVVPNAPGGGYDTYARLIAPFYEKTFEASVVVDNVEGAGGLIGANAIKTAKPDGLTIGIINAPGLMMAYLSEETNAPNPARDFTILARVVKSEQAWLTGANSELKTMDDLFARAKDQPIVFGIRDVGGLSFLNTVIGTWLLDISHQIVSGYPGSRDTSMAAIRGEVDVIALTLESVLDRVEAGDLRVLMQSSDRPISDHPSLAGVPTIGGPDGVAARRAAASQRDAAAAVADAAALAGLIGAGRLLVAPLGLPDDLSACMKKGTLQTLELPAFRDAAARAKRSLDTASGDAALAALQAGVAGGRRFLPIVREAVKQVRE